MGDKHALCASGAEASCCLRNMFTSQMRKCAMEAALQQEVTAHAAAKAHHGLLQDCVASLLIDVQEQHSSEVGWVVVKVA